MPPRIDLTGQRFGYLEVMRLSEIRHKNGTLLWECLCHACGQKTFVLGGYLRHGKYKSCGCMRVEKSVRGMKKHIASDRIDGTRKTALKAKLHKNNKSGHKGVMWLKSRQKWMAYIGFRRKNINLGYYKDKDDAINARKRAEEIYHKPYKGE